MSDLRSDIQRLAADFVASILAAMRSASLSDLAGQAAGAQVRSGRPGRPAKAAPAIAPSAARSGGRRHRATAAQVQQWKDAALAAAKALKGGFSKADVMKKSGSKVDLGRAISLLVADGKLTMKGTRRKARYWVK